MARVAALASVAIACSDPQPLHPGPPRNVLLVVVDTLRADHLGSYGYERATSPRIDALADRGVVFENAFATSPWTAPSVASILTGQWPSRHGAVVRREAGQPVRRESDGQVEVLRPADGLPDVARRLGEHGFETAAFVTNVWLGREMGITAGFQHVELLPNGTAPQLSDAARAWLARERRAPFFLLLHYLDPHYPYEAGDPAAGHFLGPECERDWSHVPLRQLKRRVPMQSLVVRDCFRDAYDEEILQLDLALGSLLDDPVLAPVLAETLVIFVSDHGEELWDHGLFEHGHRMLQELVRVPLVAAGPGLAPGRVETPVSIADLAPTIAHAVGLPGAFGPGDELAGRSWWPEAGAAEVSPTARPLVAENNLYGPTRQALVRWPWKLASGSGDEPALFHLEDDPGERRSLARERPEIVRELEAELTEILERARSARGDAHPAELSTTTFEELRALGYVE